MDHWPTAFLVLGAIILLLQPSTIVVPQALSLTIINLTGAGPHAIISFVGTTPAARIAEPFHWDLISDVNLSSRYIHSAKLTPPYFQQLLTADQIVIEEYHGVGNWSRHTFSSPRFTTWNITHVHSNGRRVAINLTIDGVLEQPAMLAWTTVQETILTIPHTSRGSWIKKEHRGGYWPYQLHAVLTGPTQFEIELPAAIIRDVTRQEFIEILKTKANDFNVIPASDQGYSVTTITGSLEEIAQDVLNP